MTSFFCKRLAGQRAIEVDGVHALGRAASPCRSSRSMTTKRLPSMRDMSVTELVSGSQLIYKSARQPLSGGRVVALHAQRASARSPATVPSRMVTSVLLSPARSMASKPRECAKPRHVGAREHQRVIRRAHVVRQFHRRRQQLAVDREVQQPRARSRRRSRTMSSGMATSDSGSASSAGEQPLGRVLVGEAPGKELRRIG